MSSDLKCPRCKQVVQPDVPACPDCGEKLFVEHIGTFPRDATAVEKPEFRDDKSAE